MLSDFAMIKGKRGDEKWYGASKRVWSEKEPSIEFFYVHQVSKCGRWRDGLSFQFCCMVRR
jgi:hypothetical protein